MRELHHGDVRSARNRTNDATRSGLRFFWTGSGVGPSCLGANPGLCGNNAVGVARMEGSTGVHLVAASPPHFDKEAKFAQAAQIFPPALPNKRTAERFPMSSRG